MPINVRKISVSPNIRGTLQAFLRGVPFAEEHDFLVSRNSIADAVAIFVFVLDCLLT